MNLTEPERRLLAVLADCLIPEGNDFPSASQASVADAGLDQLLSVRSDLLDPLKRVLLRAKERKDQSATEFLQDLQTSDPASFGVLAELVPGAYFLNSDVRAKLKYDGQSSRPIEAREDYLEDALLQSVIDRGPIYRPTPPMGYDWRETYDWNYDNVPEPQEETEVPVPGEWNYCGMPVNSPLGIAAGPLLNGKWILFYASLGFDVLTYKTVRSRERGSYPLPNLQPIRSSSIHDDTKTLVTAAEIHDGWAVSFGMPSRAPEIWRADIERTRNRLPTGKILSVSVVATPQPNWTIDDLAADFALCARWAIESGADCVEANFSCPNVASADAQLFQQPETAATIAARIRQTIGSKPLLIKIGHITDESLAASLVEALSPHANALVMVNCIPAKVIDQHQRPLFQDQARGIAGPAIYDAALAQVRLFHQVIREQHSALRLVGVGGIASAAQVQAHLQAGSHAVQLATAAMLNPLIGRELRDKQRAPTLSG